MVGALAAQRTGPAITAEAKTFPSNRRTTMRIGIGGYLVAVNTFATQRMGIELFQRALLSGDAVLRLGRGESAFAGFMEGARERNWEIVPIHFVFPGIMGKVTDDAHEWAKETFLK